MCRRPRCLDRGESTGAAQIGGDQRARAPETTLITPNTTASFRHCYSFSELLCARETQKEGHGEKPVVFSDVLFLLSCSVSLLEVPTVKTKDGCPGWASKDQGSLHKGNTTNCQFSYQGIITHTKNSTESKSNERMKRSTCLLIYDSWIL